MVQCHVLEVSFLGAVETYIFEHRVSTADKPNIIIFLADDLGYADIGVNGCKDIPTSHIDSITAGGVRFTDGYKFLIHAEKECLCQSLPTTLPLCYRQHVNLRYRKPQFNKTMTDFKLERYRIKLNRLLTMLWFFQRIDNMWTQNDSNSMEAADHAI